MLVIPLLFTTYFIRLWYKYELFCMSSGFLWSDMSLIFVAFITRGVRFNVTPNKVNKSFKKRKQLRKKDMFTGLRIYTYQIKFIDDSSISFFFICSNSESCVLESLLTILVLLPCKFNHHFALFTRTGLWLIFFIIFAFLLHMRERNIDLLPPHAPWQGLKPAAQPSGQQPQNHLPSTEPPGQGSDHMS